MHDFTPWSSLWHEHVALLGDGRQMNTARIDHAWVLRHARSIPCTFYHNIVRCSRGLTTRSTRSFRSPAHPPIRSSDQTNSLHVPVLPPSLARSRSWPLLSIFQNQIHSLFAPFPFHVALAPGCFSGSSDLELNWHASASQVGKDDAHRHTTRARIQQAIVKARPLTILQLFGRRCARAGWW